MRELSIKGRVRRVESGSYTDKTGNVHPKGTIVLEGAHDKFELELGMNPSDESIRKLGAVKGREGSEVEFLVGVVSGDTYRADARFVFLDELSFAAAK